MSKFEIISRNFKIQDIKSKFLVINSKLRVPTIYVLSRNKKNNVYPCKPQFYCIKVGFKGGQNYIGMFS